MNRKKFDVIIVILTTLAAILSIVIGQFDLLLSSIAIGTATLARPWTRYVVILAFIVYIINSFASSSISIIGIVFWFLIVSRMYTDWQTDRAEITFINLDENMTGYYANLFLILVVLSLVINLVFSGFDLQATLSFTSLFSILSSSLQFLGIYMLAMRIFEGCYFYAGYIIVKLIMIGLIIGLNGLKVLLLWFIIYVLQLLIMYLFKQRNY